jgi:hypothetical protein
VDRAETAGLELVVDDRLLVAVFLVVLLFGGFGAYTLQFVPGVKFIWRWIAWSAAIAFGFLAGVMWFADVALNGATVFGMLLFASFCGAVAAAGGWTRAVGLLATRASHEQQKKDDAN